MQVSRLSDEESEVPAARRGDAMGEQSPPCRERHPILGVVEQVEVEAYLGQHLGWVCTQALNDRRNGHRRADAERPFLGSARRPLPFGGDFLRLL